MGQIESKYQESIFKINHIIRYCKCKWTKSANQTEERISGMAEWGRRSANPLPKKATMIAKEKKKSKQLFQGTVNQPKPNNKFMKTTKLWVRTVGVCGAPSWGYFHPSPDPAWRRACYSKEWSWLWEPAILLPEGAALGLEWNGQKPTPHPPTPSVNKTSSLGGVNGEAQWSY